ncbi:ABC transporter ATP-binding protein [Clostridium sp. CTA-19]
METVLRVENVYKSLGGREIIKGINFDVKEGEIFGFLGANGAGKTTTIRMLVGLIKPDKGKILIMGHNIQNDLVNALGRVGSIVENPDLYKDLTGRENLKIFSRMYRNVSKEYMEDVIEMIGLKDRIDDKVRKYSLGMKQRLGVGQALLCKPKLLILDEPTNGLDPVGIYEFRNTLKKLAKGNNTTIFISSHILAEIEQVCDRVAFIQNGIIKSIDELNKEDTMNNIEKIFIKTHEIEACKKLFSKEVYIKEFSEKKDGLTIVVEKDNFLNIISKLLEGEIYLDGVYKVHDTLEEKFMKIIEGDK